MKFIGEKNRNLFLDYLVHLNSARLPSMTLLSLADNVPRTSPAALSQTPNSNLLQYETYLVLSGGEGDLKETEPRGHILKRI
jgi:hypothetical protein